MRLMPLIPAPSHLAAAVVAMLMLPVAASCYAQPEGEFVTAGALAAQEEISLIYPDATIIGSGGEDASNGLVGYHAAFYGHRVGTDAGKDDVIAWYEDELEAAGYGPRQGFSPATTETDAWQWWKGDLRFHLSIQRQGGYYARADERGLYRTIYEVGLYFLPEETQ